jgi:vacuolar-type H+-ATPase subunit H
MSTARERLQSIDSELLMLQLERDGAWGTPPASPERREAIQKQISVLQARRQPIVQAVKQEQEVKVSRDKARTLRKEFREKFAAIAQRYTESQLDKYPIEFRQREGAAILKELDALDAALSRGMLLWHYGQKVEAARLRATDPIGDAAAETRRLRERMEADALAEQYPSRAQARNLLLPEAERLMNAGNLDAAQVYLAAARKVGGDTSRLDLAVNRLLDRTVPHRRQAVEIEVMAADEMELARRDAAAQRLAYKVGSPTDLVRASNTVQMADYKRRQEAPILKQELGIELPASTD